MATINKNRVILTSKGNQVSTTFRASQCHSTVIRKNGQRVVVIMQHNILFFTLWGNAKIMVTHHCFLHRPGQQIIINGILHPYSKSKRAEKIFVCSIKQRIRFKVHTFSLIRSPFRIQESLRDQATLPAFLCILQSWQDYPLH